MDENLIADNAVVEATTTEGVATPQATENPDSGNHTRPDPTVKSDVDITQTQAFSQRLKAETQKKTDAVYSKLYGEEYGIHSEADYDAAIMRQQMQQETGVDPDTLQGAFEKLKASDPDFQELQKIREQNNVSKALTELNEELKDIGIDLQLASLDDTEIAKLPNIEKVTDLVRNGKTLSEAVFLANKKEFFAKAKQAEQQDTIKKISANGASSPGSLTGGTGEDDHITAEMFQAKKSDPVWIQKNYDQIQKSRAKW